MLTSDEMRFAMDDARRRHAAVVDLIGANDRQALGFLQLYVALTVAAASGAAAILFGTATSLPHQLGEALVGFSVAFAIGAVCALAACWPSNINLPGRDAAFWQWASEDGIELARVYRAYMETLAEKGAFNTGINLRLARRLTAAKAVGAAAPLLACAAVVGGHLLH